MSCRYIERVTSRDTIMTFQIEPELVDPALPLSILDKHELKIRVAHFSTGIWSTQSVSYLHNEYAILNAVFLLLQMFGLSDSW